MSHLWPIGTNFSCPERQSSRTANTVVDILSAMDIPTARKGTSVQTKNNKIEQLALNPELFAISDIQLSGAQRSLPLA